MTPLKLVILMFFLCGPELRTLSAQPVILSIGDSLTFGLGVPQDKTWPALLEARLRKEGYPKAQVINAGSSGATTAYGISALRFQLKRHKPDLIVYALGANDALRGLDPAASYRNMEAAMDQVKERKVKALILGMKAPPNYGPKFPQDFEATYTKLAKAYQVELVPFFLEGVAGVPAFNQADGIHPNEKGYEKVIETIYPQIKELLR